MILEDVDDWANFRVTEENKQKFPKVSKPLRYIGGVDISFVKGDLHNACAALVVISYPELKVCELFSYFVVSITTQQQILIIASSRWYTRI